MSLQERQIGVPSSTGPFSHVLQLGGHYLHSLDSPYMSGGQLLSHLLLRRKRGPSHSEQIEGFSLQVLQLESQAIHLSGSCGSRMNPSLHSDTQVVSCKSSGGSQERQLWGLPPQVAQMAVSQSLQRFEPGSI